MKKSYLIILDKTDLQSLIFDSIDSAIRIHGLVNMEFGSKNRFLSTAEIAALCCSAESIIIQAAELNLLPSKRKNNDYQFSEYEILNWFRNGGLEEVKKMEAAHG